ncbi:hypothetical protein NMY22_g10851 [Coprinellus aureogranulatus]|nr:hypothetical protein NMY22_g10851 [Coprinellus aureogranulatus]
MKDTTHSTAEKEKKEGSPELSEKEPEPSPKAFPHQDSKRVLECLQKALRIANSAIEEIVTVQLYCDTLDQYLYYLDRGAPALAPKFVNSLVELITSSIDNISSPDVHPSQRAPPGLLEGVQTPEMITRHFRNTLVHIQAKKNAAAEAAESGAGLSEVERRWEEVDVVGAMLKMGIGRQVDRELVVDLFTVFSLFSLYFWHLAPKLNLSLSNLSVDGGVGPQGRTPDSGICPSHSFHSTRAYANNNCHIALSAEVIIQNPPQEVFSRLNTALMTSPSQFQLPHRSYRSRDADDIDDGEEGGRYIASPPGGRAPMEFLQVSPWKIFVFAATPYVIWRLLRRLSKEDPLANIPGPPPDDWLTGSFMKIFPMDSGGWEYHDGLVQKYGKTFKFKGLMGADVLYTYDQKAMYHIILKDQDIWEETREFRRTNGRVFGNGLFSTMGEDHRRQRKILNPVFSVVHIRDLTPTFYNVTHKLVGSLSQLLAEGEHEASTMLRLRTQMPDTHANAFQIDLLPWLTRTALELVGQSGFAYSFDTLEPDAKEHRFARTLKNLFSTTSDPGLVAARNLIFPYVYNVSTPAFQRAVVNALPWKALHELRDMVDIMHNTSLEILEESKRSFEAGSSGEDRIAGGKDIMTCLLKANMEASEEERLPDDELVALISTMIFAAMDTTSNALSRILVTLGGNPRAQEKLRQEIVDAGEDLDYDKLTGLPYLDAVCRETLRLYTPIPFVFREAGEDLVLPLLNPVTTTDGKELYSLVAPKHTSVLIQITQQNKDPDIWGPDAAEWKPERWLSPLPASVADARVPGVYSSILTFLGGSRSCIGFKFAQLEMKIVLSQLIRKFKFAPGDKRIIWQLMPIVTPTTEDAKLTPAGVKTLQLPVKISLIDDLVFMEILKRLLVKDPLSKIAGPAPSSWATGSLLSFLGRGGWEPHEEAIKKYGKTFRFKGLFGETMIYTYDTKAMYHMLIKDRHVWDVTDEARQLAEKVFGTSVLGVAGGSLPIEHSCIMFSGDATGSKHRKQRKLLNPAFSVAHLRTFTPTFYGVAKRLEQSLRQGVSEGQSEVDILGWMTRTAVELVGLSGFGYSFDSLALDAVEHRYTKSLKNLLLTVNDPLLIVTRLLLGPYLMDVFPATFERWVVNILPWPKLHELRDMIDITWETAQDIMDSTRRGLQSEKSESRELEGASNVMKLLVKGNMEAPEEDRMSEEEIKAQISAITFAAMDTTSNGMSRILHILSGNPEVQERLRKEILDAASEHGPETSYETLMDLPYLDAVCKETLRLHPPFPFAIRAALEDTVVPLAYPVKTVDGNEEDSVMIPKGTKVFLPLHFTNRDPDIWGPEAHEWRPERWLVPLPETVTKARVPGVFSNLMTFLGGNRSCPGFVFAQLEMKVVLVTLLRSFRFTLTDKEIIWRVNNVVQPTTADAEVLPTGDKKGHITALHSRSGLASTLTILQATSSITKIVSILHVKGGPMEQTSRLLDLPEEIGRIIVGIVVGETGHAAWVYALVSRGIKSWIEPLLYRRIDIRRSSQLDRLAQTIEYHPTKPDYFFALNIKDLTLTYWNLVHGTDIDSIVTVVQACPGVLQLGLRIDSDTAGRDDDIQRLSTLLATSTAPQIRLTVPLTFFPGSTASLSHSLFQNISHLEVEWLDIDFESPSHWDWTQLSNLRRLTHICVHLDTWFNAHRRESYLIKGVSSLSPWIQVFMIYVGWSPVSRQQIEDLLLAVAKIDIRSVICMHGGTWLTYGRSFTKTFGNTTWIGRNTVPRVPENNALNQEFWSKAEALVKRRKEGLVEWPPDPFLNEAEYHN